MLQIATHAVHVFCRFNDCYLTIQRSYYVTLIIEYIVFIQEKFPKKCMVIRNQNFYRCRRNERVLHVATGRWELFLKHFC